MIDKKNKKILRILFFIWSMIGVSTFTIATVNPHSDEDLNSDYVAEEAYEYAQNETSELDTNNEPDNYYKSLRILSEVFSRIKSTYVEEKNSQDLADSAIKGMLEELDPHTTYFTPEDFEEFQTETEGEFGGLGITISKQDDYITVISPIEGTPAYRMGIMAGDKIVKVDGEDVVGISTQDVIKLMRGEKGTKVLITIKRPGVENELDFDITRDIIEIKAIPYSFKLDEGLGYVRIRQFNKHTTQELVEHLDELEKDGINGLILDLRSNPGGLLNEAVDSLNEFIGPNKRVVYTKGRMPRANSEYITRYNKQRDDYPIIVLINEASASASEILAGSIQDYDRGLVLGRTSFGKGSVQQLYPLTGGYGIKVTVAKYYINSGRCIHKDLNDKLLKGEKVSDEEKEEIEAENHEHVYYTASGRKVYGGGGIKPDIDIKPDLLNDLGIELRRKNLFFKYAIDYLKDNKDNVDLDWRAHAETVSDFVKFAEQDSVEIEKASLDSIYSWVENSISQNIISSKFGPEEGYKVSIQDDKQIIAAKDIFEKYPTLPEMFEYAKDFKPEDEDEE